jgi:N-terminal half of MaoC dehydratase
MTFDESAIGREIEPFEFPVERGKIRELATAILDDNPVYFEAEDPPAPLTFTRTMNLWSDNYVQHVMGLGVDLHRMLHGGQDYEYLGPVRAGDVLTVRGRLAETYTKEGKRGGVLRFIVHELTFTNQAGEEVIRTRNVTIETSQAATQ